MLSLSLLQTLLPQVLETLPDLGPCTVTDAVAIKCSTHHLQTTGRIDVAHAKIATRANVIHCELYATHLVFVVGESNGPVDAFAIGDQLPRPSWWEFQVFERVLPVSVLAPLATVQQLAAHAHYPAHYTGPTKRRLLSNNVSVSQLDARLARLNTAIQAGGFVLRTCTNPSPLMVCNGDWLVLHERINGFGPLVLGPLPMPAGLDVGHAFNLGANNGLDGVRPTQSLMDAIRACLVPMLPVPRDLGLEQLPLVILLSVTNDADIKASLLHQLDRICQSAGPTILAAPKVYLWIEQWKGSPQSSTRRVLSSIKSTQQSNILAYSAIELVRREQDFELLAGLPTAWVATTHGLLGYSADCGIRWVPMSHHAAIQDARAALVTHQSSTFARRLESFCNADRTQQNFSLALHSVQRFAEDHGLTVSFYNRDEPRCIVDLFGEYLDSNVQSTDLDSLLMSNERLLVLVPTLRSALEQMQDLGSLCQLCAQNGHAIVCFLWDGCEIDTAADLSNLASGIDLPLHVFQPRSGLSIFPLVIASSLVPLKSFTMGMIRKALCHWSVPRSRPVVDDSVQQTTPLSRSMSVEVFNLAKGLLPNARWKKCEFFNLAE